MLLPRAQTAFAQTATPAASTAPPPPFASSASSSAYATSDASYPLRKVDLTFYHCSPSRTSEPAVPAPSPSSSSTTLPSSPSDSALSPVFGRHVPLPKTHGVHVATVHLRSYTDSIPDLQFFTSFALRSARALGLPTSGAVALPTRTSLYTTPRSPFAHKKSQQNFWRKEHKRAIKVWDGNEEVVHAWLAYLRKEAMGGVGMKAQVFSYRPVGWGNKLGTGEMEEGLAREEQELLLKAGSGSAAAEVERLAKELEEELKLGIQESERIEKEAKMEGVQGERKTLEEVPVKEGDEVPVKGEK
ncbi:SPOSA6832_03933 [Sporobolomyces salmonicolor]|uniref:Small ribosomal subunit protein uS10m n=1 Tax=Sporidiobolus salmonicolor TaxID=5005 RepID=A0A0D6EQN8_SPOSA|nr:SPOSA6832_03933 [Sporobolomyces salmonicolor]